VEVKHPIYPATKELLWQLGFYGMDIVLNGAFGQGIYVTSYSDFIHMHPPGDPACQVILLQFGDEMVTGGKHLIHRM